MKNNKLVVPLLILFAFVLTSLYLFAQPKVSNSSTPKTNTQVGVEKFLIEQKVNYGEGKNEEKDNSEVKNGESVLDLISRTKKVEVKEYSFGKLVESIEGVKNGTNDKYWIFYVNGEESKVGAGDYKLKPNDKVEWKFKAYEE